MFCVAGKSQREPGAGFKFSLPSSAGSGGATRKPFLIKQLKSSRDRFSLSFHGKTRTSQLSACLASDHNLDSSQILFRSRAFKQADEGFNFKAFHPRRLSILASRSCQSPGITFRVN